MKRFVEKDWVAGILGGTLGAVVAAVTGADAGETYLIGFGVLAIVLGFLFGPDRVRLWREEHGTSSARRRSPR